MRILVTGATGFIGRALVLRLRRDGHGIVALTRSPGRARQLLGSEVDGVSLEDEAGLRGALEGCDAVVNLAGEPVIGKRWTARRKQLLRDSRVELTRRLVSLMAELERRPRVLVSSSGVDYYADRGAERVTEQGPRGSGFLAALCRDWEAAAEQARASGVRVVTLRTGLVLGAEGGALARMLPAFRAGLGGPIGSGTQYMTWLHLHDLVALIRAVLADARFEGPINAAAPQPVTSREFALALGQALNRPVRLPVPGFVLRALFGEGATPMLAGHRVVPERALALGFEFQFPELAGALADLLVAEYVSITPWSRESPAPRAENPEYLRERGARYLLETRTVLGAPPARTFEFFSKPANLALLTPARFDLCATSDEQPLDEGSVIEQRLRIGPIPVRFRARIERWEPNRCFVDAQQTGPYRVWWHEHHFEARGEQTLLLDRVYYGPPLGMLGRLMNRCFIAGALRRLFGYRRQALRLLFGLAPEPRRVAATPSARSST